MSSVVHVEMHWIWSYTVSMGFHQLHLFSGLPSASFQEKVSEKRSLFRSLFVSQDMWQAEGLNQNNNLIWLMIYTLQGTNISPKNGILKMIFLFPRWDMLIPWRVYIIYTSNCNLRPHTWYVCQKKGMIYVLISETVSYIFSTILM